MIGAVIIPGELWLWVGGKSAGSRNSLGVFHSGADGFPFDPLHIVIADDTIAIVSEPGFVPVADVVAPADFDQCFTSISPCCRSRPLMCGELELSPEPNAPGLRSLAAFIGPRADQLSLELSKATQDR